MKIDFRDEEVHDEHARTLVKRCSNLEYLNLIGTSITHITVQEIVKHLPKVLKDLSLPERIGTHYGLLHKPKLEELGRIGSMTNLKHLHIGCHSGWLTGRDETGKYYVETEKHIIRMKHMFPHLTINTDPLTEGSPRTTDPQHLFNQLHRISTKTGFKPQTLSSKIRIQHLQ